MYKVLLVEDDLTMQLYFESLKVWKDYDFLVAAKAGNGKEALQLLEKEPFDLIVSDISMPFMDGVELLRTLRETGCTTPMIFVSSYSDFAYAQQGILYGLSDYLLKPVLPDKLAAALSRLKTLLDEKNEGKISPVVSALLQELELNEKSDDFIFRIAAYCSEHYKEDLSGDVLAAENGYNTNYFGTVFKQHFGMTHRVFVNRVKVAYAIELLRSGTCKAYEISDLLGFSSYKYFSEKFKSITGVAPTEYRNRTGNKY